MESKSISEEHDEFEQVLYFCIDRVYLSLKREREFLFKKLIDKSFANDILEVISELYKARADIHEAYKIPKTKAS